MSKVEQTTPLIDYPKLFPRDLFLRPLHELDRALPDSPGISRLRRNQDLCSRRTGGTLSRGQCCRRAETIADRLGQSRLIHLSFYAGDNLSVILDPAFHFHEAAPLLNDV
jgi:hypothetical protein